MAVAFAAFRVDALSRVQGPLIADSSEYVLMAHHLLTGAEVPVAPLRTCLFPLLISAPIGLGSLLTGAGFDADAAWIVPLAFHVLAVLGAFALGRRIGGSTAGLLAALFAALLTDFGFWASDCLTDVPAAACIVWSLVFWLRGRPLASGLVMSLAVLLRYQTLLLLPVFLLVAAVGRERRRLLPLGLGLLLVPLGLAALDGWYWGEPFLTFREHFSVFADHFRASYEHRAEAAPLAEGARQLGALELALRPLLKAWYSAFLRRGPELLSWTVVSAFLSWVLARRWSRERRAGDAAFGLAALTFLVLCVVADDDTRYLVAITPIVAAVGGACASLWIGRAASLLAFRSPRARRLLFGAGLVALGVLFGRARWLAQQRVPMRPFGAMVDAVEEVRTEGETVAVGVLRPWILARRFPASGIGPCTWSSDRGLHIVDLACLERLPDSSPPGGEGIDPLVSAIRDLDYVVLTDPDPRRWTGSRIWPHIERMAAFDGVRYDRAENREPAWRFRMVDPGPASGAFREVDREDPGSEPGLALFDGGLRLMEIRGVHLPGASGAVRFDFHWRIDQEPSGHWLARVQIRGPGGRPRMVDRHAVMPASGEEEDDLRIPGTRVRISRYLVLPGEAADAELLLRVGITDAPRAGEAASSPLRSVVWSRTAVGSARWVEQAVEMENPLREPR